MELYFLRHGLAVPRGTPGFRRDADRPLTPAGIKKLRQSVQGMKKLGLAWDRILSSPYRRAKQTAEIVTSIYKKTPLILTSALTPQAAPKTLIALLQKQKGKRLLLVGHEPFLSQCISFLLTGREKAVPIVLKKGGLCLLTVDSLRAGPCAALCGIITPRPLRLLGKA